MGARYPATPQATDFGNLELDVSEISAPTLRLPADVRTRFRVLTHDLDELAAKGGSRVADGVLSIVTGGLSITLGVFLDDHQPVLGSYLYLFGGANVARGIIDLLVTPDPHTPALEFSHMPMRNVQEAKERLAFGEAALERLAYRSRLTRILDAAVSTLAGVAFVPVYLARRDGEPSIDTMGYFVMIGAGISVISGVISLTTPSDAERRWNVYSELRRRLASERRSSQARPQRHASLLPKPRIGLLPGGAALGLSWHM